MFESFSGILVFVPIIVFLLTSSVFYYITKKDKEKEPVNYLKIGAPGILLAVLVFLIIKYKDTFIQSEPVMTGNYFD